MIVTSRLMLSTGLLAVEVEEGRRQKNEKGGRFGGGTLPPRSDEEVAHLHNNKGSYRPGPQLLALQMPSTADGKLQDEKEKDDDKSSGNNRHVQHLRSTRLTPHLPSNTRLTCTCVECDETTLISVKIGERKQGFSPSLPFISDTSLARQPNDLTIRHARPVLFHGLPVTPEAASMPEPLDMM